MEKTIEKLADIKMIRLRIKFSKSPAITSLYKFIFEERSRVQKYRLRDFKGFSCEKKVPEYDEKSQYVNEQLTITDLKNCCTILGLEQDGKKKKLIKRIFNGLMNIKTLAGAAKNQHFTEKDKDIDENDNGTEDERTDNEEQDGLYPQNSTQEDGQTYVTDTTVEVSIQHFNGDNACPVERWMTDIENVANLLKLTEEQKVMLGKMLLTGLAKMWVKDKGNINTWRTLKTILKELSSEINNSQLHKNLTNRKMGKDEKIQDYYVAMKELAQNKIKPEMLIQYVINGIPDDTNNKAILYGTKDLENFSEKLKLYETIDKEELEKMGC